MKKRSSIVSLSVVVPCYNEAQNLPALVNRVSNVLIKRKVKGEIVLVNDGSRDDSTKVMKSLEKKRTSAYSLRCVHHKKNQGIAAAWKTGVEHASGKYICLIDADLQNLPEDIWRLYRELQYSKADVVQGYRSSVGRLKNNRYVLSKTLNFMLNVFFGTRLKDNKSGFICTSKEIMTEILRHRFKYFYFQSFIGVSSSSKGYSIKEVETLFEDRILGRSFIPSIPLVLIVKVCIDLFKAFFEFRYFKKKDTMISEFIYQNPAKVGDERLSYFRRIRMHFFFLTLPLHTWMLTRNTYHYYKELKKSQWLSTEKIKDLQEKKLRKLIRHAYNHTSYYREVMDQANVQPEDIQHIEDLKKIPLLTKALVKESLYFDLLSGNHDKSKILKITTSGSTGEPFVCFADQHQLDIRWSATLRGQEWAGYQFGDRQARLWHQTLGMTFTQVVREKLNAWLSRRLFIPAFSLDSQKIEKTVRLLEKYKPTFIDGYAESFNLLARYLSNREIKVRPKGIMTSAQVLPEKSRETISSVFHCGVFDKYGSREFSGIAYECDHHKGHHIVAENYIVEVLKNGKPAKPGEVGEIVITDLNNYCMPFIRYRIGDLGVAMDSKKPCSCGRGLPMIGDIEGRVQSIIMGANGVYLPNTFFSHLFKDYDYAIEKYQVIQLAQNKITLKIIKADRFQESVIEEITSTLKKYLGEEMKIKVQFTKHIPMVRTGKHQTSISKLKIDFQEKGSSKLSKK